MIRSKIASPALAGAKKMLFLGALLALALHVMPGAVGPARAQGTRKDDIVFNSRGIPLAGATVRVCAMPASGQPCTPLALIYSDAALTQALANPTTTDGLGNYFFYAAPGKYEIEISGPGITTKQLPNIILPNDPASPAFSGGISAFSLNLSGNLTVNGSTTVLGNLASGTLNLSNQATPPGAAGAGTVNLYTKTADKRLYYKDDTGTEVGPISSASGAQTNVSNTFTASQNFDSGMHVKGPDPYYDVTRFGAYSGGYPSSPTTTGNITAGQVTLTTPTAFDVVNGQYVTVYGAGPASTLYTPGAAVPVSSIAVTSNVATIYVPEWYCSPGQNITISGSSDLAFNGTFTPVAGGNGSCNFPVTHANCSPCTIGGGAVVVGAPPFVTSTSGIINGSTTYQYKIVAEDFFGGLSAASAPVTISTGAATLGANSVAIAANACSRDSTGLSTITTSVAHNFAVGAYVHIVAGSTGDATFEGSAVIISTPTSTTFTFYQYGAKSRTNSCPLGGTAKVVARNILRWNQRFTSIIGHWIYRCTGVGCTNYALIGHADGPDGAFTDLGLTGSLIPPGYVSLGLPPSSPTNQWLSAKVNAGGGTATLTLSAAASNTVSGATVLHDNTPVVLAICAAAPAGGTIYWPDVSGAVYPITTTLDMRPTCAKSLQITQAGRLNAVAPIVPQSYLRWIGAPQGSGGATAPFAVAPQAQILGNAYPLIYQTGSTAVSSTYENLQLTCFRIYQGCYYSDPTFSNGTNMIFRNFAATGQPGNFPMRPSGQFFYLYEYTYFSNNLTEASWGAPEPFIETVPYGFGPGTGVTSLVYDLEFRFATFQGGGVLFDSQGQTLAVGADLIKCQHCLLETALTPMFRFNTPFSNNGAADWDFEYLVFADSAGGGAMPMIDVANITTLSGVRAYGMFCANGGAPLFALGANLNAYTSISVGATGACGIGAPPAVNPDVGSFGNQQLTVGGTSLGLAYLMPAPSAPTVSVAAGGSIPVGIHQYAIQAIDSLGNATTMSQPAATPCTTTTGNQTCVVSWTLLPGQVGTRICSGTTLTSVLCDDPSGLAAYNVPGTSFTDSGVSTSYTATPPLSSLAASAALTATNIVGQQIKMPSGGFVSTLAPPSAGFTANRAQTLPDNTGIIPVTSYINSAYDNATRANGAIGSNWTVQQGGLNVASNQFQGAGAGSNTAVWNANSFSPVQFAQATITALNGTADYPGVTALASGIGSNAAYYDCVENSTTIYMQRVVNLATTNLTSTPSTGAVGDVLRLEAAPGGALACYKNGSVILTATDTQITSGSPGLLISGSVATEKNWSGGNLHPLSQLDVESDFTRVQHLNAGIAMGSETFTASPRAEQNVFLPGALTSAWTGATWTVDKAVILTRIQVQAKTAPAGCTTNAIVRLTDGTTPVNVTISAAANDSGAISQNYAAGSALQILVQTAALGCTASPADANVIVQYRMQ